MNLLVIRHAIAEDKEVFAASGRSDDLRPLTEAGRTKMRRAAEGLRLTCPRVAVVASSPLLRARETADIVAPLFRVTRVEIIEALRPERPFEELTAWLRRRVAPNGAAADTTVAVVGHEPHLSGVVTWLMTSGTSSRIELKKGGACLLRFDRAPARGRSDASVGADAVSAAWARELRDPGIADGAFCCTQ